VIDAHASGAAPVTGISTEFWVTAAPNNTYYGVPFHNFVAWFGITAVYVLCTEALFRWTRSGGGGTGTDELPTWAEIFVPIVSIGLAAGLFVLIEWQLKGSLFGHNGVIDIAVLSVAMFSTLAVLLEVLLRADQSCRVNLPTLVFPMLFHVIGFVLTLVHFGRQPTLPVFVLANFAVGFLAYSWPFQERLARLPLLGWLFPTKGD
jgi:hypothetical protein